MTLPIIPTQSHNFVLSNNKTIKLRPFSVSEQKIILHAVEMKDPDLINNAVEDLLNGCVLGDLDINTVPIFDIERLIVKLRSISISEISDLQYTCRNIVNDKVLNKEQILMLPDAKPILGEGECDTKIPVKINLNVIELNKSNQDDVIMFTDTIGVRMVNLSFGKYKLLGTDNNDVIDLICACVDVVIHGDDIIYRKEIKSSELKLWIDELSVTDYNSLVSWVNNLPTLRHEFNITCPSCKTTEHIILEGLESFLG